jgi:large subunit ribosomal protein L30
VAGKPENYRCLAVVRVRGTISAQREARETLDMLHLSRTNHAVLVVNRPSIMGMLKRVQSYVTWGEISEETLAELLMKKGRLTGDKKLTDEYIKKIGCNSNDDLAAEITSCKVEFLRLPDIQPLFKLHPPRKGYKGTTKKNFRAGGEAGYRGAAINDLVKRMM